MDKKLKVNLLSLCTVFFWGASYPVTKIALGSFTSHGLSFLRCLTAALLLTAAGLLLHIRPPRLRDIPLFFLCGGVGFAGYLLTYSQGLLTLSSATSSLIVAVTPILTAIYASFFWKEKIRPLGWLAIASAFGGVALLLLWDGALSVNAGLWWTFGAAAVFCIYNLCCRVLANRGYRALDALVYNVWAGVICLVPFSAEGVGQLAGATTASVLALLFLGCFPSAVSYLCWNRALALAEKTNDVTNYMFVTPLFSTLIGLALLREVPAWPTLAGGAVIIGSILAFNRVK